MHCDDTLMYACLHPSDVQFLKKSYACMPYDRPLPVGYLNAFIFIEKFTG